MTTLRTNPQLLDHEHMSLKIIRAHTFSPQDKRPPNAKHCCVYSVQKLFSFGLQDPIQHELNTAKEVNKIVLIGGKRRVLAMIQAHFDVKVHYATHLFHEQVLDVQFVSPFGESLADSFPITRYSYTAGNQNTFPLTSGGSVASFD